MRNIHKENLKVRILHFLNCRFFLNNKKFKDCSFTNQHSTHYYADIGKSAPKSQTHLVITIKILQANYVNYLGLYNYWQWNLLNDYYSWLWDKYICIHFCISSSQKLQSESWICSRHFARLLLENFYRNGQKQNFSINQNAFY